MKKLLKKMLITMLAASMLITGISIPVVLADDDAETGSYVELSSPAVTYNMNVDWKFKKPSTDFPLADAEKSVMVNGKHFYEKDYDDSGWETVSVPHAINAEDSFDGKGVDAGEASLYRGFMFYRKNITVPQTDAGKKFILEFESVRQSVYLYVNGTMAGYYEAGITAMGFDITPYIIAGQENIIAVATDNSSDRGQAATFTAADGISKTKVTRETIPGNDPGDASGYGYQWNTKDFNEVQGGITGNVNLYAKNKIYQTLPLYNNLKTTGNYVYGSNFNFKNNSADITVEAEVRNESGAAKNITLQVDVVDSDGTLVDSFTKTEKVNAATDTDKHYLTMVPETAYVNGVGQETGTADTSTVQVTKINATKNLTDLKFWSDVSPNLYTVYTYLKDGETVIDAQSLVTGFRDITYDKDKGLQINGTTTYFKGYAQRSTNEWAAIGVANDWLEDIDMQLVKESNANFIRWMHVAPKPNQIRSGDKYGVVSIVPAGDKEGDATGRAWDQRLEAMRDTIIYYRNSPSAFFYEAGNNAITATHMRQMRLIREALDNNSGRMIGCRTIKDQDQIKEAEWVGTMLYRNDAAAYASMQATNHYIPMLETEYHRNESPRRVWDDYSPPFYDYVNRWLGADGKKEDGYDMWDQTQEDFSRTMFNTTDGYSYFYNNRASGSGKGYYTGAAMMVWSDSNMHDRNCWAENCRTSGRVDAVREKKESFYAIQAAQSTTPKIHILGHWNYPSYIKGDKMNGNYWYEDKTWTGHHWEPNGTMLQRDPTTKTVYVIGSAGLSKVELYVNGELKGTDKNPDYNYIYAFDNIDVTQSGKVSAKAYNDFGDLVAEHEISTVGKPVAIRLTPVTGPDGLIADGSDLAYFDVEVIDENGKICPLDERKINFSISGEGVWMGGYNSGVDDSVGYADRIVNHKYYVYAECGTNRVFVHSTRNAGTITITATAEGMQPVSASVSSTALELNGGLTTAPQRSFAQGEVVQPPAAEPVESMKLLSAEYIADFDEKNGNVVTVEADNNDEYKVLVNGKEVQFTDQAYKPDSNTGVVGEIGPVLDAIKEAGANFTYSYTTQGEIPDFSGVYGKMPYYTIISGDKTIYLINDATDLFINGERNLMNFMPWPNSTKTALIAELATPIQSIDGVTMSTDGEKKIVNIMVQSEEATENEYLTYDDGKVTITANEALDNAVLILAGYNADGSLVKVVPYDSITLAKDAVGEAVNVDNEILAAHHAKAMLWKSLQGMESICGPIAIGGDMSTSDVSQFSLMSEGELTLMAAGDDAPVGVYGKDQVLMTNDCNNGTAIAALEGIALSDDTNSPDGTKYFKNTSYEVKSGAGYPFASIGGNSTADIMWEADVRFDVPGSGITPYSDNNGTLGTCVRRRDKDNKSYISVQTGSSAYTNYCDITNATDAWYHIALVGRYSAADAQTDMYVFKYNGSTREFVAKYDIVNQRNMSAGNGKGADHINVHTGTSIDNVRITKLAPDTLTLTSDSGSMKAGGTMSFAYGATRQGVYVSKPAVTWSIYNEDNTAELNDSNISIEDGLLSVDLNAESKTITVRIDDSVNELTQMKKITIEAVNTSNLKFDELVLDADRTYVSVEEPLTIKPSAKFNGSAVTLDDGDLIWSVYDDTGLNKLGDDLKWITINNGVLTVDKKAVSQDIIINASDPDDIVRGSYAVHIKSSDALEGNADGSIDKLILADNCEAQITNSTLAAGAPDGTHFLTATSSYRTANITETSGDVVFEMDIRFNGEGSGFNPGSGGKLNTCIVYHNGNICVQTGGSAYTKVVTDVSTNDWYHVTLITKPSSYAHLIFEKYDENGERISRTAIPDVNMRNDKNNAYINMYSNTSYDNVRVLKPVPTDIQISTDVKTVFAGGTVKAAASLWWNGLEMKAPAVDDLKFAIYDSANDKPLTDGKITVNADGTITVDALANTGDVYIRAISPSADIYESTKITIMSSDIFEIQKLGINEDGTEAVRLYVAKNFYYVDDVTFVVAIYGNDNTMKDVEIKSISGENLKVGEVLNEIAISLSLDDFDKTTDTIKAFAVTRLDTDDETETDGTLTVSQTGKTLTFTTVPNFDSGNLIVMALDANADETNISKNHISYIGLKNSVAANDTVKARTPVKKVKAAGKINDVLTIKAAHITE